MEKWNAKFNPAVEKKYIFKSWKVSAMTRDAMHMIKSKLKFVYTQMWGQTKICVYTMYQNKHWGTSLVVQ